MNLTIADTKVERSDEFVVPIKNYGTLYFFESKYYQVALLHTTSK